jgi:hypothetical protein
MPLTFGKKLLRKLAGESRILCPGWLLLAFQGQDQDNFDGEPVRT